MNFEMRRFACAALLALAACGNDPSPATPDGGLSDAGQSDAGGTGGDAATTAQVMTDHGPIIGHASGAITAFLGIPYAAPPVGALRWAATADHAAWTAPLDAAALGPACSQTAGGLGQSGPYSEDCLTLNVWTPSPTAHAPVMVFIHGGVFIHGSSNQPGYDGAALAAAGSVVVTLNYRLGVLGFLAHPALTAEDAHHSSGNAGLLDQQAALRWVHANIAALGGDPANVTIFGESAGSMSVCAHIVSPLAAGLFHRALGESGTCLLFATPLHTTAGGRPSAEAAGLGVAQALGCDTASDVLACMRARSTDEVLAASPGVEDIAGLPSQPNIDGYVLPEPPAQAFAAGRINRIDSYLGGTNLDEATLFSAMKTLTTEADYEAAITALVPTHASDAIALYDPANYPSFKDAYNAALTDLVFVCPTRVQARRLIDVGTTAYAYELTWLTALGTAAHLGVYHGSELPFVFGNLTVRSGMSAADRAFSNQVIGAWTRFAATGDPNGGSAPAWPPYAATTAPYLDLGDPLQAKTGLHHATCDVVEQWH
jgi:para-nitrobenzyl esterase